MKLKIDKEWCLNAAKAEEAAGDPECGAGSLAADPIFECPECHADLSIATHTFGCRWVDRGKGYVDIID